MSELGTSSVEVKLEEEPKKENEYAAKYAAREKLKIEQKAEKKRLLKERRAKHKETKEVGFNFNDSLKQTDYYFENGLRKVYPYDFHWNTTAKERWFGRTLHDVYKQEFSRAIVHQPLEELILSGKIQVNDKTRSLDYVIKNGDRVSHSKHRHEIPVLGDPIKVVHEDEDYLVVDKPCSIPMHPCGKYRYNSLSIILAKEFRYTNLRTLYRLDRLTSGCVILGKNFKAALVLDKHIKERTAIKTYLCRVGGEFPPGRQTVDQPIDCASRKIGLYWLQPTGKKSKTEFERLSYNGTSSVVRCWPKTGRTHQIRLHLQYLGFPILNDPLYNQPTVWGSTNGKNGQYELSAEQIEANFLRVHTYEAWIVNQERAEEQATSVAADEMPVVKRKADDESVEVSEPVAKIPKQEEESKVVVDSELVAENASEQAGIEKNRFENSPGCFECTQTYRDPCRKDLTMYLHALSYKFGEHEFKTDMPYWAYEDFVESVSSVE